MANMIKWVVTSAASYAALETKETNALYFLQDTGEIYKGAKSFTEAVQLVEAFPAAGALGKMYVNSVTLEGKVWTGSAWKTVIKPVATTLTDETVQNNSVTGEAIKQYVTEKFSTELSGKFVEEIGYDKATKDLTFVKDGKTNKVAIDGFVTGATYAGETGTLSFQVEGGQAIDITLPKDNFVESGTYDSEAGEIVLTLVNGGEVRIPAADLVDTYTVRSSETVAMTMTGNEISAEVKVSGTAGNALSATENGLFVAPTDITGKLDKVAAAKAGEILTAKADGQVEVSGFKAGAEALGATPDAKTLATEAAVNAIKLALQANIDKKFDKANIKTTGVAARTAATASDAHVLSEKATLTRIEAMDAAKIDKSAISTEVIEAEASATKVVSETALVQSLSWTVIN